MAALLGAAIALIAATFDPNDYKPLLVRVTREATGRTLLIPGAIRWGLFPRLAAEIGRVSLSERDSAESFASAERASLSLALWPLLSRRFVVDRVYLDGLTFQLRRYPDGRMNIDDLLARQREPSQLAFEVAGVTLRGARVDFDDQAAGGSFEASVRRLEIGRIAPGSAAHVDLEGALRARGIDLALRLDGDLALGPDARPHAARNLTVSARGRAGGLTGLQAGFSGNLEMDLARRRFAATGVALRASGQRGSQALEGELKTSRIEADATGARGAEAQVEFRWAQDEDNLHASFGLAPFTASEALFVAPVLTLDADWKHGESQGGGRLSGPLRADLRTRTIELGPLALAAHSPNPAGGEVVVKANGAATLDLASGSLVARIDGRLDGSVVQARFSLLDHPPSYALDAIIDRIDADRYLAPAGAKTAGRGLDLAGLAAIDASGSLRVGLLRAGQVTASGLRFEAKTAGRDLRAGGAR